MDLQWTHLLIGLPSNTHTLEYQASIVLVSQFTQIKLQFRVVQKELDTFLFTNFSKIGQDVQTIWNSPKPWFSGGNCESGINIDVKVKKWRWFLDNWELLSTHAKAIGMHCRAMWLLCTDRSCAFYYIRCILWYNFLWLWTGPHTYRHICCLTWEQYDFNKSV